MKILLVAMLLSLPCIAQGNRWTLSVGVLVAGTTMDLASSYGAPEANPLMRSADGRLGAKGAAFNAGFLASAIAVRVFGKQLPRKWRRVATAINFSVGGCRAAVAARNWRL